MAEISLRAYIEYLDDRLDRDAYSEVMAQCRHILETYPKYVEIYKRLARALAAQENYTDALDLFQRVLSVDPTDFVSHIGMSECYKEDGALDQAIWHLERAFEQVPSNSELQEALRELYEQRDRKAPRKIQMSGGALARMYIRGKLYPQAISELTKAISRDPERLDLQVLMAEALWNDHQYVAAGKVAAEILKKIPYSIAANRILVQLWIHAGQPKEARPFLERVKELDPYLGYEFEHNGQMAPADAFQLIMLDYAVSQVSGQVGVADWVAEIDGIEKRRDVTGPLRTPDASVSDIFAPSPDVPAKADPEAATPDWLQEALHATGSTPAGGAAAPGALAGAEPDWLREALTGPETQPSAGQPADEAPDWLADVVGEAEAAQPPATAPTPASSGDEPDWLKDVLDQSGETQPPEPPSPFTAVPGGDAPDWLQDVLTQETPAQAPDTAVQASTDEAPAWLQDALSQETFEQPSDAVPVSAEESPAWLQDLAEEMPVPQPSGPSPEEGLPEQDEGATSQETPAEPAAAPPEPVGEASPEDAPEWIAKVLSEKTPPSLEPVPEDWGQRAGEEERVAPEWLDSIVSGDEAAPVPSAQAQPETPSVVSEEWLDEFITSGPAAVSEEPSLESSDTAAESINLEALGDLETWDASQEVSVPPPPEGWLTQDTGLEPPSVGESEEESQELPDWLVAGAMEEAGSAAGKPEQSEPEASTEEEIPDWLKVEPGLASESIPVLEEEKSVASPDDELRDGDTSPEEEIPDWLASGDLDSDDALKWIEELAAKVDPDFKPSTFEDEEVSAEVEAEPVAESAEEPVEAEAKVEEEAELPVWLQAETEPTTEAPEPTEAEELPAWLKSEAQPAEPVEAAPGDIADLEWLREPTEAAAPTEEAEEEEGLPAWLRAEAEEKKAEEEAPEPSDALAWLDQQAADQGVSSGELASEALTPDQPPMEAPLIAEDVEAQPITTGELPSWLKEADAREEMAKALESPVGELEPEMAELPELPVEADELAWLNETLKAEEQAASIDLEDILGEKAPAEEAEEKPPEWLAEPETVSASAAKPEEEEGLPEWLKESEPVVASETQEEDLPEWLKEPEPAVAAKPEEEKEGLPEWLKESEPLAAAKAEGEEIPPWLKEPEPVSETEIEEKEEKEEEKAPVAEEGELPEWLKEPEEAPVTEVEEGAEELPDWLTQPEPEAEAEPVAAPAAPAPVLEIDEEEGELPSWLTTPEPAVEEGATDLTDFLKAVEPATAPPAPEPQPEPEPEPAPVAAAAPLPSPPAAEPEPAAPPPVISVGDAAAQLQAARAQLEEGERQEALSIYEGLVNAGQHLDETIEDLSKVAESQVVVNPRLYRVMGDAMMGQGRMQEALEMYRKALDQF